MPLEYFELSGMLNAPLWMANVLSPNGSEKKHNLYRRHPSACTINNNSNNIQTSINKSKIASSTAKISHYWGLERHWGQQKVGLI